MEDFLRFMLTPLVADPESIQIAVTGSQATVIVPQSDMGKVIGKHGQMVAHLRTLLRTYCKNHHLPNPFLQVRQSD
jgi:predicted RNA-binding protein YlqC (UPF0109 family)